MTSQTDITALIISPDIVIRDIALLTLSRHNIYVQGAIDAASAMQIIERDSPGLIFLDTELRWNPPKVKNGKLILLSQTPSSHSLPVIPKPLNPQHLADVVAIALG